MNGLYFITRSFGTTFLVSALSGALLTGCEQSGSRSSGAPQKTEDKRSPGDKDSSQSKDPATTTEAPATTTEAPSTSEAKPEPAEAKAPTPPSQNSLISNLETAITRARVLQSKYDAFPLVRTPDGLALLPKVDSVPLTNGEAIGTIDYRLKLQADLERAKAGIEPSPSVREALAYNLLTPKEVESLQLIRKELTRRPSSEKVDASRFAAINDLLLTDQRAKVVAALDETVSRNLAAYGLRLTETPEGPALDPKSRAGLDDKLKDRAQYSRATAELQAKLEAYSEFLKKWGLRSTIQPNEVTVLNKVRIFGAL